MVLLDAAVVMMNGDIQKLMFGHSF